MFKPLARAKLDLAELPQGQISLWPVGLYPIKPFLRMDMSRIAIWVKGIWWPVELYPIKAFLRREELKCRVLGRVTEGEVSKRISRKSPWVKYQKTIFSVDESLTRGNNPITRIKSEQNCLFKVVWKSNPLSQKTVDGSLIQIFKIELGGLLDDGSYAASTGKWHQEIDQCIFSRFRWLTFLLFCEPEGGSM